MVVMGRRWTAVLAAALTRDQSTVARGAASHDRTLPERVVIECEAEVFENVIEAMVDAVLVVDVEGRINLNNTAAASITGYAADELRAMTIGTLLVDDSDGMRTVVRRRIQDGSVVRRESSWLVTKGGERIPVSVTGSPVLSPTGDLQGIVLVARDVRDVRRLLQEKEAEIAARKAAEAEVRLAKASIEEQLDQTRASLLLAERRATLGTLAGGVGHELRNIAQIQVAAVDELSAAIAANEDVTLLARQIIPDLERVGEHITAHGQRLMQLARPGPDRVDALDLNTVARDVVDMLRGAGKLRHVTVTTKLADGPLTITVNRTRIEQILVNLVINAVDAIGDRDGKITIEVHPSSDQTRVVCVVRDNGSGIAPEQIDRIFQPFFTTKPEDKGTGLGLPVAREIVQSYGGNLIVESRIGVGTSFTFDLPR
ncbi:MAG: PAS domain S-box protein [Deltaproteobacteria bacterium]|nr:PAS domain S-box protein [Deltaproteobacteria bacterium]MCW5807375.1 PAS domain S-box protein [Deltaproteobacteria bacterium]